MSNEEVDDLQLRVAKAIPSDVGHGRARVPFDNDLNLKPGDIVEITGEQKTAAIVWRCRPEDANLGIIRVDGIIRKNAGVSLGDKVSIRKVETQPCQKLILSPVMAKQQKVRFGPGIEGFARRGLNKRPVVSGDRIFIPGMTLFAEALPFQIVQTTPKGIVQVLPDTEIIIKEEPVDEEDESGQPISTISYEDIGGIGEQLQKVREMIELPLKHPILFRRLGIDPPRGVLLHGPPGTGKTLIAKAVASETKANFTSINGPEIISKYYGESEKQLREIFDEAAANSPAIIFIDELDSIAPKREDVSGEVERRVVAQLLTLLDGMQGRDNVIVIGATNRPDAIDPALRRGGRFDRELEIGVPDKNGRAEIIGIHTRGMPISDDFEIDWLLDNTHGFVGADISALVREAAMKALRRYLPEIDLDEEQIPAEVLEKMEVRMSDFKLAIKEIEPSALREIFLEVPEVSWDQVGGLKEVKERLKESIEWPLTKPEMFEHFGINPPRGIVLFGAPGTGKTLIAKAIANEAKANFITIKGPELISKWVGDSEKAVRELFKKAKQSSPFNNFLRRV
jgi:transitional endoplasmic reticulum ATPase